MKYTILITASLLLAACGVDGEPSTPEPITKSKTGITVSGHVKSGVHKTW